jgi:hypothetical protein
VRCFDASLTRSSIDGFGLYLIPDSQDRRLCIPVDIPTLSRANSVHWETCRRVVHRYLRQLRGPAVFVVISTGLTQPAKHQGFQSPPFNIHYFDLSFSSGLTVIAGVQGHDPRVLSAHS